MPDDVTPPCLHLYLRGPVYSDVREVVDQALLGLIENAATKVLESYGLVCDFEFQPMTTGEIARFEGKVAPV